MAGEHRDVERAAQALEHVEVLRHAFEVPAHAGAQHVERHAFDLRQVAHHQLAVAFAARGDGEAAVADDRGGDAEARRGRSPAVPGELRVVVRVVVDDARHQRQALGVHRDHRGPENMAHLHDAPVLHRHAAAPRRGAEAVDQNHVADHEVEHRGSVY
jgi:hypothetical protein